MNEDLAEMFRYNAWANRRLFGACRALSREQFDTRVRGISGSVRELFMHIAAPRPWVEPSGDEAAWIASLSRLKEVQRRLKLALEQVPEDRVLEAPAPDYDRTLLELILPAGPAHEAHHAGQIDYLKVLQAG